MFHVLCFTFSFDVFRHVIQNMYLIYTHAKNSSETKIQIIYYFSDKWIDGWMDECAYPITCVNLCNYVEFLLFFFFNGKKRWYWSEYSAVNWSIGDIDIYINKTLELINDFFLSYGNKNRRMRKENSKFQTYHNTMTEWHRQSYR